VTGNWQPGSTFTAAAAEETAREEEASRAFDQKRAQQLKVRPLPRPNPDPVKGQAELSLEGWSGPLRAGEERTLTLRLDQADGILALDLALRHDGRVAVVSAAGAGIGLDGAIRRATFRTRVPSLPRVRRAPAGITAGPVVHSRENYK
jgi:hypothetical protein